MFCRDQIENCWMRIDGNITNNDAIWTLYKGQQKNYCDCHFTWSVHIFFSGVFQARTYCQDVSFVKHSVNV